MDEYARMRFTLSWRSASRLPATIEATATAAKREEQRRAWSALTGPQNRRSSANTAPLDTVAT